MRFKPNRLLRKFGYEVRRLPVRTPPAWPPPDPDEIRALEAELDRFAADQPADSALADAAALRGYLSDKRLALFNDLLRICRHHGIDFAGRSVADVGSGTGYLLRLVSQAAPESRLTGYDTFADMMALACRLCPAASFQARSLFEIDASFDIVFCTETLEHLEQPAAALEALFGLVAPGGWLILTVPDGRRDQHGSGQRREDGSGYWGHIHFWSPESWQLFLAGAIGARGEVSCGQCSTSENYALIRKAAA
ncbi:MAG: class I SAM-dependent methyltransferase [Gammaproteobacteria bacterium]|nr:class I SAM-dependent methyltransferase [Gammaproteobacteria bacterium]